jgi:hypothetical protein
MLPWYDQDWYVDWLRTVNNKHKKVEDETVEDGTHLESDVSLQGDEKRDLRLPPNN